MSPRSEATPSSGTASVEHLTGEVIRLTFYNPETGHTVAIVQTATQAVTAVGKMPDIQPGESVSLEGQWTLHPVYGPQFAVRHATASRPNTEDAMQRYLGSGLVP